MDPARAGIVVLEEGSKGCIHSTETNRVEVDAGDDCFGRVRGLGLLGPKDKNSKPRVEKDSPQDANDTNES
jgi:hypothetical protein